jgi:hypothetical protein
MIIFIAMMYVLLAVFKSRLNNEHKVVDIETDTAADFTIMVTYLPKTATEQEVCEFFENHMPGVKVARVSLAYNIERLNHLLKEKKHAEQKLINHVRPVDEAFAVLQESRARTPCSRACAQHAANSQSGQRRFTCSPGGDDSQPPGDSRP